MVSPADVFSSIAAYYPTDTHPARLPYAFLAAHPSARLVAEMREAQRAVYFQFLPRETAGPSAEAAAAASGEALRRQHGEAALRLATATTPLFRIEELLARPPPRVGWGDSERAEEGSQSSRSAQGLRAVPRKLADKLSRIQLADVHSSYQVGKSGSSSSSSSDDDDANGTVSRPSKRPQGSRYPSIVSSLACCGTSLGGLTTILVSRSELVSQTPDLFIPPSHHRRPPLPAAERKVMDHHMGSGTTLRQWLHEHEREHGARDEPAGVSYHLKELLPKCADSVPYLFAPTTASPVVLSMPEAMHYHEKQAGLTGPPILGVDDHRHKLKTAMATAIAHDFLSAHGARLDGEGELFRLVLVANTDAVTHTLLGVSKWWLQRPVRADELPTSARPGKGHDRKRTPPATAPVHPPLRLKFISDVFAAPSLLGGPLHYATLQCAVYLYELAIAALGLAMVWPYPSALPNLLPRPVDRRRLAALQHRHTHRSGRALAALSPAVDTLLCVLLCVVCLPLGLVAGALLTGWELLRPPTDSGEAAEEEDDCGTAPAAMSASALLRRVRLAGGDHTAQTLAWMGELGEAFSGAQDGRPVLQGLDASHTSLTGSHVLALAPPQPLPRGFLRSLDLSGCPKLHVSEAGSRTGSRRGAGPFDVLCPSHLGRAVGRLAYCGSLQWLNAAGSTLDSAAVASLGTYGLLREALAARPPAGGGGTPLPRPSLLAVNITSCRHVSSLNGFAYVSSLAQLLAPFGDLTNSGVDGLNGDHFPLQLSDIAARMEAEQRGWRATGSDALSGKASPEAAETAAVVAFLRELSQVRATPAAGDDVRAVVRSLARRFTSHVYHLDVTFCNTLRDVNGLLHAQRVLQFLSIGETPVSGAGLGADVRRAHHVDPSDATFTCPLHKLTSLGSGEGRGCDGAATARVQPWTSPLRVLIGDPCDHVDSLRGLRPSVFPSLEKLYIRSASLEEEGVAAVFAGWDDHKGTANGRARDTSAPTVPFPKLRLMDLSYCDKLHDVSVFSRFPALHTLNLDNTEVAPVGLANLRSPTGSLKVLSLRHCPEIMDVLRKAANGTERLKLFREAICDIPSLETVIVEEP